MKKTLKGLVLVLVLFVGVFSLTGCGKSEENKKENKKEEIKNAATASYSKEGKGTVSFQYEDNGKYTVGSGTMNKLLTNEEENFKIYFDYSPKTTDSQLKDKEIFSKGTGFEVKDVTFNGYEGYVQIGKKSASAKVFLFVDKDNDVIVTANISEAKSTDATDGYELYDNSNVKSILKSIKYEK